MYLERCSFGEVVAKNVWVILLASSRTQPKCCPIIGRTMVIKCSVLHWLDSLTQWVRTREKVHCLCAPGTRRRRCKSWRKQKELPNHSPSWIPFPFLLGHCHQSEHFFNKTWWPCSFSQYHHFIKTKHADLQMFVNCWLWSHRMSMPSCMCLSTTSHWCCLKFYLCLLFFEVVHPQWLGNLFACSSWVPYHPSKQSTFSVFALVRLLVSMPKSWSLSAQTNWSLHMLITKLQISMSLPIAKNISQRWDSSYRNLIW